jgi:hypothetical protein
MRSARFQAALGCALALLGASSILLAGYKPKPWSARPVESYPARLASEKVTIAVDPLYTDAAAGKVFDKKDIVTRGIMPLAIIVFNDNDFPVVVEGNTIELIQEDDHLRSLSPIEVVGRLFPKSAKSVLGGPTRLPGGGASGLNQDALEDFEHKYFGQKIVPGKASGGGFLYLRVPERKDLTSYLSSARVYIPEVMRQDTGANLIYFEVELKRIVAPSGGSR